MGIDSLIPKEGDSRTSLSNMFWCLPVLIVNFSLMYYLNHSWNNMGPFLVLQRSVSFSPPSSANNFIIKLVYRSCSHCNPRASSCKAKDRVPAGRQLQQAPLVKLCLSFRKPSRLPLNVSCTQGYLSDFPMPEAPMWQGVGREWFLACHVTVEVQIWQPDREREGEALRSKGCGQNLFCGPGQKVCGKCAVV